MTERIEHLQNQALDEPDTVVGRKALRLLHRAAEGGDGPDDEAAAQAVLDLMETSE